MTLQQLFRRALRFQTTILYQTEPLFCHLQLIYHQLPRRGPRRIPDQIKSGLRAVEELRHLHGQAFERRHTALKEFGETHGGRLVPTEHSSIKELHH